MLDTEVLRWNHGGHVYVLCSDGRVLRRLHSSSEGFTVAAELSALDIPVLIAGVIQNPDCVVVA